jgi:hypothetical protein
MAGIAHSHRIPLHITEINIFNKSGGGGGSSSSFIFRLGKIISPFNLSFPGLLLTCTGAIH